MRLFRSLNPIHVPARRPLAAVCLAAYLLTWLGVPLPMLAAPVLKDTVQESEAEEEAEPFPCQDCHCHCSSAEQCWQGCCCFTMTERIEWARANDVTPPSWVQQLPAYRRALAVVNSATQHAAPSAAQANGCSHCHAVPITCSAGDVTCPSAAATCTPTQPAVTAAAPMGETGAPRDDKSKSRWLVLLEAQACLGLSLQWVTSGAAMPTPPPLTVERDLAETAAAPLPASLAEPVREAPPVPPPQAFAL